MSLHSFCKTSSDSSPATRYIMKTCKRCFREFDEEEVLDANVSPAIGLADIMLRDLGIEDINDLCPQCREKLGVMDLLGFGQ